jgi:hypothetical protein
MSAEYTEAMLSEFDYWQPPMIQSSIVKEYDEVLKPASTLQDGQPIEFELVGAPNLYRDLNNSYLVITAKVVTTANANTAADTRITLVNNAIHSMFSSAELKLCGKTVTDKETLYPYRAYIESLLTYDADVLNTREIVSGWAKDEAARMDNTLLAVAGGVNPSAGFVARNKITRESRTFTLVGRPRLDLFHQSLDIPPECSMILKFTQSTDAFRLIGLAAHKLSILTANLYIRTKVASPELVMAHREMLNHANIRIPFTKCNTRSFLIPGNSTSYTASNMFTSGVPKRIVIGFVENATMSGTVTTNPFNFGNFGITDIHVEVNGTSVPEDGLSMNYATDDFQRAYLYSLSGLGLDTGNRAIALTPEEWKAGYNLYVFKLSPGSLETSQRGTGPVSGNVSVHIKFAAAHAAALSMIVYSETGSLLEITALNDAIIS